MQKPVAIAAQVPMQDDGKLAALVSMIAFDVGPPGQVNGSGGHVAGYPE